MFEDQYPQQSPDVDAPGAEAILAATVSAVLIVAALVSALYAYGVL